MGIFSRKKPDVPTETAVGAGVRCQGDADHGNTLKVERYHRGSKIFLQWPESDEKALKQVKEVADNLQKRIDVALDRLDSDEELQKQVLANGSVYPEGVDWSSVDDDTYDYVPMFGYVEWPDGCLEFYFKDGTIFDIGHVG